MKKPVLNYVIKVVSTTLVLGLVLGGVVVYIDDIYYRHSYNNAWDNPFLDFLLFLLIGIGESVIPSLIFYIVVKTLSMFTISYARLLIYLSGIGCSILPFVQLYYMVNEGYHRSNVIVYAACFGLAIAFSFRFYQLGLNDLLKQHVVD